MLSFIYFDPSPAIFSFPLPLLGRPLLWYGFFFALGCLLGYCVLLQVLKQEIRKQFALHAKHITDKLSSYILWSTLIWARLGDVLFYQDPGQIWHDPAVIFRVWEGGLASHGGVIGLFIGALLFAKIYKKEFPSLHWRDVLDWLCYPAGVVAAFIRLGNLMNQEILGTPTQLPWAFVFGHPCCGLSSVPRHPVQLYEALFYLLLFCILCGFRKKIAWPKGKLAGSVLLCFFLFRFFIETLKEEQSLWMLSLSSPFLMGQWLSLPFILFSLYLLLFKAPAK